jgi:anaerobic selenocysteine-containing dehydrogenase
MTTFVTACPLDCPDTCSLEVVVERGRLTSVDAGPGNPFTQGFICHKVKHHARRVYAPERVLTPLVRTGAKGSGSFAPLSWDDALDLVAGRLGSAFTDDGPASVLPYVYNSSAGELAADALVPLLFARLGVPPVAHTICAATAGQAWDDTFGDMLSADPLDLPQTRLVVLWGANPTVSNTHLLPLITEAKRNGAVLVVVDPRRTGVAARADEHLSVRPGTDVALAYALARLLRERGHVDESFCASHATGVDEFLAAADDWSTARAAEVCGIATRQIEELARLVAGVRPAMLRVGWGAERNRNGGSSWRAILGLWVLAGQFGERGGGILTSLSSAAPLSTAGLPLGPPPPTTGEVNMNRVGAILCGEEPDAPPARVLFVQGANPAATAPDQGAMLRGLAREDLFTVVHDQVLTDTAVYADVVLPATTHFEADDVAASYGSYVLQPVPAVIDRVGESRTNNEVAAGLAVRLGLDMDEFDPDPARLRARMATDGPIDATRSVREPGQTVQFVHTVPSFPDRRARLVVADGELRLPRYRALDSRYPLALISPATAKTINTMFAEFGPPPAVLSISPADASARGIVDGATVRVWNEQASITLPCCVDASLREGVGSIPKGLWLRHVAGGRTVNSLVPATLSDLAGGACFNDTRVEVAAVPESRHSDEEDVG